MSNPVIEQVKQFADMEDNDIGEMPGEELRTYAAQAALKSLIANWEVAMGDGTPLRGMVEGDIDAVIDALTEIKGTLVKGLGDRLDEDHTRQTGPSR